jgi:Domain of unknown function (DUF4387)
MRNTTLGEIAKLIRSKNAGPFELTFDILFEDLDTYNRVVEAKVITPETVGRIYSVKPEDVRCFYCENALAIKASIPRPYVQGDIFDSDGYGGQQYAPLIDIRLP